MTDNAGDTACDRQPPARCDPAAPRTITKVFPGTVALDDVTFNVYHGKVNVLVGENGAGKSTLMKILAGVEQPTQGSILLEDQEIHLHSPLDATRGHRHHLPGTEPVPQPERGGQHLPGARDRPKRADRPESARNRTRRELIERLEQNIDPDALVGDLRIGQQQIVEIAKALAQDVRILIMDEPTSALSTAEVEVLFRVINELKAHGVSIIYISHKLDELLQIGDYVTVLRDGQTGGRSESAADINVPWIIEKMVGQQPGGAVHPHGTPDRRGAAARWKT